MTPGTICFDLDGVLAEYDGWRGPSHIGKPIPEGVDLAKRLRELGFQIIIFTCRLNGQWPGVDYQKIKRQVEEWLDAHGVPYDRVATQVDGKPFADAYVDDRAIHFPANRGPAAPVLAQLLRLLYWEVAESD
ncbi:MAG: capsular biosynthesis protein [Candidatus Bathyarchaeota archaeon]